MKKHIENVHASLGELGKLSAATEKSERGILARAESRFEAVSKAIDRQRPGVEGAPENAQDRYLELVRERGTLQTVISKAKKSLNE